MKLTTNVNFLLTRASRVLVTCLFLFLAQQVSAQYQGSTIVPNPAPDLILAYDIDPAWATEFPEGNLMVDLVDQNSVITAYYDIDEEPETGLLRVGTAQVTNVVTGEVEHFNITWGGGVIDIIVVNL